MAMQDMVPYPYPKKDNTRMALLLAIHCAPVLRGVKAANIVTVSTRELYQIKSLLQGTGISSHFFKTKDEQGILYLFREQDIFRYLSLADIQSFLQGYGYWDNSLDGMLERLGERISQYYKNEIAFPHEIGIFLEYPLLDVKGFLENEGKNSICSGYWKVYYNEEETVKKFKRYDEERERAIKAVAAGKTIREIALSGETPNR